MNNFVFFFTYNNIIKFSSTHTQRDWFFRLGNHKNVILSLQQTIIILGTKSSAHYSSQELVNEAQSVRSYPFRLKLQSLSVHDDLALAPLRYITFRASNRSRGKHLLAATGIEIDSVHGGSSRIRDDQSTTRDQFPSNHARFRCCQLFTNTLTAANAPGWCAMHLQINRKGK